MTLEMTVNMFLPFCEMVFSAWTIEKQKQKSTLRNAEDVLYLPGSNNQSQVNSSSKDKEHISLMTMYA